MGLAGGIVRRVFSKSPCSSAGGRGHNEKGSADHRRRWSSLRLYLCGEEINTAPEEEDDEGTVSVNSFETCVMAQEAQFPVVQQSDGHTADDNPEGPHDPLPGEEAAEGAEEMQGTGQRGRAQEPHFGICRGVGGSPWRRVVEQPPAKRGQRVGAAARQPEVAAARVQSEGGVGRQHGELQRVKDEDAEPDRGYDAARESACLRLLAAAEELRRHEEAVGAAGAGGLQRGVELAGAVDGDAAGRARRRLHEPERGHGLRAARGRRQAPSRPRRGGEGELRVQRRVSVRRQLRRVQRQRRPAELPQAGQEQAQGRRQEPAAPQGGVVGPPPSRCKITQDEQQEET